MTLIKKSSGTPAHPIDREAADWVVLWEDGERTASPKEQTKWFGWLRRSPRHVQSYFDTAELYERLGGMDPHNRIDVDEWLAGGRSSVFPIASSRPATPPGTRTTISRWALAAGIAALVAGAGILTMQLVSRPTYRTDVGQQSIYRLADGSVMNLNTDSKVRVMFSEDTRLIELDGEALFSVARDTRRPFYVRTRGATVRALGTKFNVYQQDTQTRVSVVEGSVQVSADSNSSIVSGGEAVRVFEGRVSKQKTADVDAAVAWQRQQLVFEDATLAEVVSEFNRYNDAQIQVQEELGRSKRLSGTFDALHPQSLLLYLRKDPELSVIQEDGGVTVSPR